MFLPENIDLAHSEKYRLSIRLSPNGFSFYFHSPADPDIFHFQKTDLSNKLSYPENIKKIIFDQGFFSSAFNKTTVVVVSPHYTVVPKPFFDAKHIKSVHNFNFHGLKGITLYDSPEEEEYSVVFNMDEEVHSFLARHLSNPEFKHHSSSLLRYFNTYRYKENNKQCFAYFHDKYVTMCCYFENKLQTALTFPATNQLDTAYYLASVWEKLSLDQTKDTLHLCGEIDSYTTVVNDMKRLIKNVGRVEFMPETVLTDEQARTLPTDVIAALCV